MKPHDPPKDEDIGATNLAGKTRRHERIGDPEINACIAGLRDGLRAQRQRMEPCPLTGRFCGDEACMLGCKGERGQKPLHEVIEAVRSDLAYTDCHVVEVDRSDLVALLTAAECSDSIPREWYESMRQEWEREMLKRRSLEKVVAEMKGF